MQLNTGDVYLAKRDDIVDIKCKFQLYLSDDFVLLINTNQSKRAVSVYVKKEECKLLKHDSYICIDNVFVFDKRYPIIKKDQMNPAVLKKLITYLNMSTTISNIPKRKMIELIKQTFIP